MTLTLTVAEQLFANVNGASFVGIDTLTDVKLTGGKKNPQQGRVTKRMNGASVMVFQNSKSNGYDNMVKRRLEKEGKAPGSFKLSPRKWGQRIPNSPFITHEKDGETLHYLEVIFLRPAKEILYFLDGVTIAKDAIVGLKPTPESTGQAGLHDQVTIRSFKLSSIVKVRIDGTENVV